MLEQVEIKPIILTILIFLSILAEYLYIFKSYTTMYNNLDDKYWGK